MNFTPKRAFDFFVDIGDAGSGGVSSLTEPQPPVLPDRTLPCGKPGAIFQPEKKITTAAELRQELVRMRKRFRPFLRNHAPRFSGTRRVRKIRHFACRPAESSDWRNFRRVLDGAGDWQPVVIPHYGEPLGRAALFYRTAFTLAGREFDGRALFLRLRGVDYKAQIFVNGACVGSHEGFFAPFEFDITRFVRPGENILVIQVDNDFPGLATKGNDGDKIYAATGPGYDEPELGWHHCPAGMGIYQDVLLEWRPPIHMRDIFVRPLPEEDAAEAWIEVWNGTEDKSALDLRLSLFGSNFRRTLFRDRPMDGPREAGLGINYYRSRFPLKKARRWEPDAPWLYELQVTLHCPGKKGVDRKSRVFGFRSFVMDEQTGVRGRLRLNGREVRLRGANTMGFDQLRVMRGQIAGLQDDILLAKIAGMNFWRITQRPVQEEVYDACDRLGLMTQTDLPLFGCLRRNQFCEAVRQAQEMEHLIRSHPCNVMVSYINEPFPPQWPDVSHRHLTRPELHQFFEAATRAVRLLNPDRVIKPIDGDFNPPAPGLPDRHCYTFWYNGHGIEAGKLIRGFWQRVAKGWDYYACGEFGAEGLDRESLMRKYCPSSWLPEPGAEESSWSPTRITQAQTGKLHGLWFDTPKTLADWVRASREHQAWAVGLQTEIYRRDTRMNSFALHLFIDAWPTGWMKTIMDCERRPKPAYFAYREALRPLLASLRTDRWSFTAGEMMEFEAWVCNDTHDAPAGLRLHYQLQMAGETPVAGWSPAKTEACRPAFQGYLRWKAPPVTKRTAATVQLGLLDAKKRVIHSSTLKITIFPPEPAGGSRIAAFGEEPKKLLRELRWPKSPATSPAQADVILLEGYSSYARRRGAINRAVRAGAQAVLLSLEPGAYSVGGTRVVVEAPARGGRQFVSRATGHPLVEGFGPFDFRLWHDPARRCISPLLRFLFFAQDWTPVLLTTQVLDSGNWGPALAVAELRQGKGRWIICQLELAGRTINPAARRFALKLLQKSAASP